MEMRGTAAATVGCVCGYQAWGADDAELRRLIRAHVDRAHPEFDYTDEQIREWVRSEKKEVR